MVELHTEARRMLEAARDARTPSRQDRERVFASLLASVTVAAVAPSVAVAAVAPSVPAGAATPSIAVAKSGLVGKLAGGTLWLKAAASVAVLSVASASTFAYVRSHSLASAPRAALAPVTAPRPAAPAAPALVAEAALPPSSSELAPLEPKPEPVARRALGPRRRAAGEPSLELSLLRQAREARRAGQPERALELAREQAEQFPHSALWAERETLRVLALCDLGRVGAARRTAAPLQYLWSSPVQATLDASCIGK